tara:strand:- start:1401 stop:1850 length:450 start_codon:yes stop_codon:yes gene_type:complete
MKIAVWGPATWNLLHTICEKIYEDKFNIAKNDLYKIITLISISVPCPICRNHATNYLNTHKINKCNTKESLKMFVYNLHNAASINANKPLFDVTILEKYKNSSFSNIYRNYINIYNKNRTDDLEYSFRRRINISEISTLLVKNTSNFNQ